MRVRTPNTGRRRDPLAIAAAFAAVLLALGYLAWLLYVGNGRSGEQRSVKAAGPAFDRGQPAAPALAGSNDTPAPEEPGAGAPAAAPRIAVSFRLDPRITRGVHLGDRWVSPPTYTRVESGGTLRVRARAHGEDAHGERIEIQPLWTPEDPDVLDVAPRRGAQVALLAKREGQTRVILSDGAADKVLTARIVRDNGVLQLHISQ